MQALPEPFLTGFKNFNQLGAKVDPLSEEHPCLGVTEEQERHFGTETRRDFLKQCRPVFESHALERSRARSVV